ncbi:MAG TPA: methylamine utilization protein [Caulobacteraceae bacterium]|jgi:plastocyanin|nr:methylamine utilization protein [Caulobacteraceae bacterium]
MRLGLLVLTLLFAPLVAWAGDVSVLVRTPQGKPVANAVVTIEAPHSGPIRFAWPYRMAQQNLQFDPFVLIVPVGADVAFPNLDTVRHHVYSFSPAKKFELKLYGHDETRLVRFDRVGVVDVGCNIHDSMIAYIVVVDTPFAARTSAAGEAVIHGVPAGAHPMRVWHPYLKAPGNAVGLTVAAAPGAVRQAVTADLRAAPDRVKMY